jgi:hypothetical protein
VKIDDAVAVTERNEQRMKNTVDVFMYAFLWRNNDSDDADD